MLRALAVACVLAAVLCGAPAIAASADATDASRELAFRKFVWDQTLAFMRARGDALVPNSPYDPMPRSKLPDAKTQFERAGGKLSEPPASASERMWERTIATTFHSMLTGGSGCCPCTSASTCNDGLFCNGAESCSAGNCASGSAACNDGNPCTNDSCTENTDMCNFTPVPPPPVVTGLNLGRSAPFSSVATLSWAPVSGANTYNIYRASVANLGGLACFDSGITGTSRNDNGAVPSNAFFFLISSRACGESGLGDGSPVPRPPAPGCP